MVYAYLQNLHTMQVLQIEEKNYEQGANLDRVCGIRDLGSNWTNQAELAPI